PGSESLETLVSAPELDGSASPPIAAFDTSVPARTLSASRRAAARAGVAVGAAALLVMAPSVAWLNGRRHPTQPASAAFGSAPASPVPASPAVRAASAGPEGSEGGAGTEPGPAAGAPASLPTAEAPARLTLDIEHSLESGALRVWVDRELVLTKR